VSPAVPAMSHRTPPLRICMPRRTWPRDSVPGLGLARGFFHPFHSERTLILVLIGSTPASPYVSTSCWARTWTVSVRIPSPTLPNTKPRPALLPTKRLPNTLVELVPMPRASLLLGRTIVGRKLIIGSERVSGTRRILVESDQSPQSFRHSPRVLTKFW